MFVTPLHDHYSPAHLSHVIEQMRTLGPPRIREYFDASFGAWYAFEGTHRLRVAKALGLVPVMIHTPWRKSKKALERAGFAALQRVHEFPE